MNPFSRDEGFSYPELLISLAILSIASLFLIKFFYANRSFLERGDRVSLDSSGSLLAYYYLREEMNRIDTPWKEKDIPGSFTNGEYRFPWYGGNEGDILVLRNRDDSLELIVKKGGAEEVVHRVQGQTIQSIGTVDAEDSAYCLRITLRGLSGESWEAVVPLRTIPLNGSYCE